MNTPGTPLKIHLEPPRIHPRAQLDWAPQTQLIGLRALAHLPGTSMHREAETV